MSEFKNATAVVNAIRYAVKVPWSQFVAENNITSENARETAVALAVLAFPNEDTQQRVNGKRTKFGKAVNAAAEGIKYALNENSADETDETDEQPKNLLTRAGLAATLEEVTAAWTAAQK